MQLFFRIYLNSNINANINGNIISQQHYLDDKICFFEVKIDQLWGNKGLRLVVKEIRLLRVKKHHSFGVNLNLVLFIPQERVFLPTVKSFWSKKNQIYFYPKG